MRIGAVVILLPCLFYSQALAQSVNNVRQTVYEGSLGTNKITFATVKTNNKDGKNYEAAHYFYDSSRIDIPLLKANSDTTEFKELANDENCSWNEDKDNCKTKGVFKLALDGENISGVWVNSQNHKQLKVHLKKVATQEYKSQYTISDYSSLLTAYPTNENGDTIEGFYLKDAYQSRILAGELIYGKSIQTTQGTSYKTITDKQTGVHYILLDKLPDKTIKQKVNESLLNNFYEMKSYAMECVAFRAKEEKPFYSKYGDWENYSSKVKLLNQNLLVIEELGSTYCGGAHPNNTYSHTVYDLNKGEYFNGNNYFNFYTPDPDDKNNLIETDEYSELKKELRPGSKYWIRQDIDAGLLQYCTGDDMNYLEFSQSFNQKGMILSLEGLPHVSGACMRDYYLIPYKDLTPFMTDNGKKFFSKELEK